MGITQETFNRILAISLFVFFGAVFVASFVTGKPVDWQALTVFLIPVLTHVAHLFAASNVQTTTIQTEGQKEIAHINAEAPTTNGLTH